MKINIALLSILFLTACTNEPQKGNTKQASKKTQEIVENGILLRYNFDQGDEFYTEVDVEMNIASEGKEMDMDMGMNLTTKINSVKSDKIESNVKYKKLSLRMALNDKHESYDSDKPESSDFSSKMHGLIGGMIGVNLPYKIKSNGEVISQPDLKALAIGPEVIEKMQEFNNQVDNLIIKFPEDKLFFEGSWEEKITHKDVTSDVKYTFIDYTDDEYIFKIHAKIYGDGMNGIQTGVLKIDKNTCMITSSTSTLQANDIGLKVKYYIKCKKVN